VSNYTQFQLTFPVNRSLDAVMGATTIILLLHVSYFVLTGICLLPLHPGHTDVPVIAKFAWQPVLIITSQKRGVTVTQLRMSGLHRALC